MQKVGLGLLATVIVGVVLLAGLSGDGFSLFGASLLWNSESAQVKRLADRFLEDLKYKDFDKAAKYHTLGDQGNVDIPVLIERLFAVKPEVLNIHNVKVTKTDFDHTGKRCRTFFKCDLETLNTAKKPKKEGGKNQEKEVEGILYWHKLPARLATEEVKKDTAGKVIPPEPLKPGEPEQWFMRLESSLHR